MIERLLNKYTFILFGMVILHIITMSVNGVLSWFDYIFIIFVVTMDCADDHNFLGLALLFGFFADFTRDAFYGPGVVLFIILYLIRFRTDVIMDMTKSHYRVILYTLMSLAYCMYNLLLTDYTISTAIPIAVMRTFVNIGLIFVISFFFKGYCIAVKNS